MKLSGSNPGLGLSLVFAISLPSTAPMNKAKFRVARFGNRIGSPLRSGQVIQDQVSVEFFKGLCREFKEER